MESLLPIGTIVICNGFFDVILKHIENGSENYSMGYRYELKEQGTQTPEAVTEYNPDNVHTIINHFENGQRTFTNERDFVSFVQLLYKENEEEDTNQIWPELYSEALNYLCDCCSNFNVIKAAIMCGH